MIILIRHKKEIRIQSVFIQKVRFRKKFDIFGGQFNETCVWIQTFQTIPMSD